MGDAAPAARQPGVGGLLAASGGTFTFRLTGARGRRASRVCATAGRCLTQGGPTAGRPRAVAAGAQPGTVESRRPYPPGSNPGDPAACGRRTFKVGSPSGQYSAPSALRLRVGSLLSQARRGNIQHGRPYGPASADVKGRRRAAPRREGGRLSRKAYRRGDI